jgi:hypothetical protein
MKQLARRLSRLESLRPVADDDEPEDPHESFVEWMREMPDADALIASYNTLIRPKIDERIAAGVPPSRAKYGYPPTADDLPFIKLLIDAVAFMSNNPEWNHRLDELFPGLESERKASARRSGRRR